MPKINSSYVKICESSRSRLAQKFSIVTRAVVKTEERTERWFLARESERWVF
jgi:hypothetical protein